MKADAMEEFDNGEDFEITFFAGMQGRGVEYGIGIFDVIDFLWGERRVDNILSEIEEGGVVIFLYGDIGMDRETGMAPRADNIDQGIGDAVMIFEHSKDFFAKDNECLRSIDMGKRMEVAVGIKNAISNKAMDVRMPCQKVAKGLDGCDEAGLKRFMGENGAKELIDSFGGTLCQESE